MTGQKQVLIDCGPIRIFHLFQQHNITQWAKVHSGSKVIPRTVLNSRRLAFDVDNPLDQEGDPEPDEGEVDQLARMEVFVANLLSSALSITPETLERNPDEFVEFLNKTSSLRCLPLRQIDLSHPAAVCIFANLYHCLLQHAMLLTIKGPLHKVIRATVVDQHTEGTFQSSWLDHIGSHPPPPPPSFL